MTLQDWKMKILCFKPEHCTCIFLIGTSIFQKFYFAKRLNNIKWEENTTRMSQKSEQIQAPNKERGLRTTVGIIFENELNYCSF